MSDTYKHKEHGKWRRSNKNNLIDYIRFAEDNNITFYLAVYTYPHINFSECKWVEQHRFRFTKCPRDSKTAKYIIQTLGHRRRRAAEKQYINALKRCDDVEDINEEKYLTKKFSSPWDYY